MGPVGISKSDDGSVRPTSLEVMFSRSWNVMMLRSLALIMHSVLSRSVGLHITNRHKSAPLWHRKQPQNKKQKADVNPVPELTETQPLTEHVKLLCLVT